MYTGYGIVFTPTFRPMATSAQNFTGTDSHPSVLCTHGALGMIPFNIPIQHGPIQPIQHVEVEMSLTAVVYCQHLPTQ